MERNVGERKGKEKKGGRVTGHRAYKRGSGQKLVEKRRERKEEREGRSTENEVEYNCKDDRNK